MGCNGMNSIHVDVLVSNLANPDSSEGVRLLVNTRAMLSVLPSAMLHRLGITREERRNFVSPRGPLSRYIGFARMTYRGESGGVTVVFGLEDDPPILGLTALGSLGYEVDNANGRLKRMELLRV